MRVIRLRNVGFGRMRRLCLWGCVGVVRGIAILQSSVLCYEDGYQWSCSWEVSDVEYVPVDADGWRCTRDEL
jgi:hypothetical protein